MVVKVKLVIMCLTGLCANLGFSAESISIAATPRYPWNGKVDLKFTIDGTSGTKYDTSFTAKDVAGGTNLTMKTLYKSNGVAANVAKEQLLPGTYNWVWDATADLGEGTVLEKVVVEGKVVAFDPLYMVIDLSGGSSAKSYPVNYLDAVPSGGWDDTYKTTKLVLRMIPNTTHYIGVFEMTQKQWKLVLGTNPSRYGGDKRPVEQISYANVNSFISQMKNKTGLNGIRIPSLTQWKVAAGYGTGGYKSGKTGDYSTGTYEVGSSSANSIGLYDLCGNVSEWVIGDSYTVVGADFQSSPYQFSHWTEVDGNRGNGWSAETSGYRVYLTK